MTEMNSDRLRELANRMWKLFEESLIEAEMFSLHVQVPREYYQSIKEDFPDRHPIDMVVTAADQDWAIDLHYI